MTWQTTGTDPATLWHWADGPDAPKTLCGAKVQVQKIIARADDLRGTMPARACANCTRLLNNRGNP